MGKITTYGCIGEHLAHSFSKEIHNYIGEYDYQIEEIAPEKLAEFFNKKEFSAINVTIPYKQAVIPYIDEIDDMAEKIQAVNTIVNRNGRLFGYNSDFYGLKALIEKNGTSLEDKKVLILGTGGTSKTAVAVAEYLGASRVERVSRSGLNGALTYDEAKRTRKDTQVIINTTPCGMYPNIFEEPIRFDDYPEAEDYIDAVYNPLRTVAVCDGAKRGINVCGGLYMLVSQAVVTAEKFFDVKYDGDFASKIYDKILLDKENIVLTGMPGCGKTTIGKILAKKLGFGFVDVDDEVVKTEKSSVADIFAKHGEKYFRNAESDAIRRIAGLSRCVIATGGGTVLREENTDTLKLNGRVFFLDRNVDSLVPTDDRPTARTADAIRKLYDERYVKYIAAADEIIKVIKSAEDTANDIINKRTANK